MNRVRYLCRVEAAVQRSGEPLALVVADHAKAPVGQQVERLLRAVRRCVVDDEELEVANGLPQDAVDRDAEVARVVVRGEQDSNERHGR